MFVYREKKLTLPPDGVNKRTAKMTHKSNKEYVKRYKLRHPNRVKAGKAKYREIHREEIRKANREYWTKHKDRINEYRREHRKKQPRKMGKRRLRFEIFKRDEFTCQYCGRKAPEVQLEIDHIIPKSQGGKDTKDNLITACSDCNQGKRDILLSGQGLTHY